MSESRTKNSARNIAAGFLNKGISIIMPFVTRTVLISTLGMGYVGLNSLFASILGVLNLAELGIGTAMVFSMYEPFARNDYVKINALLLLYKKCYHLIGSVVLVAGLLLFPFLPSLIHGTVPDDVNLYVLYAVHLLNAVLGYFLFAYKQSLFTASQRSDAVSNVAAVLSFISSATQIVLLLLFHNFYLYAIVLPLITIANNLCISVLAKRRFPGIVGKGIVDLATRQAIKRNVVGLMVQKLGNAALNSIDSLIISAFLGVELLGKYNNYYMIIQSLVGFLSVVQVGMTASVGSSLVSKPKEDNYRDFAKFNFMSIWVITWWTVCYIVLIQPFITLWLGDSARLPLGMAVLFGMYFYSKSMNTMVVVYREASGLWREGMFVPLISTCVILLLDICLIDRFGLFAPPLSVIICMVAIYLPFYSYILFKHYFVDLGKWIAYLRFQILHIAAAGIITLIVYLLCDILPGTGLLTFMLKIPIVGVLPNLFFGLIFSGSPLFGESLDFVSGIIQRISRRT